jgi:hypothetical protein
MEEGSESEHESIQSQDPASSVDERVESDDTAETSPDRSYRGYEGLQIILAHQRQLREASAGYPASLAAISEVGHAAPLCQLS